MNSDSSISDSGKKCWCFGSNGLQAVGQTEVVFVLQCLPEETSLPRDIFNLYVSIYQDAEKGMLAMCCYIGLNIQNQSQSQNYI